MTCSSCGMNLGPDVHFCTRCGAAVAATQTWQPQPGPAYAGVPVNLMYSRVARHLQVLGVLWIVYAFERTVSKLVGLSILHGFLSGRFQTPRGFHFGPTGDLGLTAFWPAIVVSLAFGLALSLLTGYALLTKQPWGRIIAIVAGILALFHPFLGTALGIYTLWVVAPGASGAEYDAIANNATQR